MKRLLLTLCLVLSLAINANAGIFDGIYSDNANITSGIISGTTINSSTVGDTTPAAGTFTALNVGKTDGSAGGNAAINATLGTELAPALTGATTVNWTFAGTYTTPLASTIEKAGAGTDTITPTAATTIVAGTTYKVVITFSAFTVTGASYTLGGVTGTALAAGTLSYTDYITASTTGKFILTPIDAARFVISSISIKALTNATGDLTVDGNIVARSQILAPDSLALTTGLFPPYSFANDTDTGIVRYGANILGLVLGGGLYHYYNSSTYDLLSDAGKMRFGSGSDVVFGRDTANALAHRNSTTQQIIRIYNTADAAMGTTTNYERLTLTGVQGASVNITAETAGTGGDNLDIVLTPAGTGALKSVTKFVHSGTPDVVSSAGAISVQTAITHVVTNGVGTVLTLAVGVEGQVKYIVLKTLTSGGQTDVVTPDGGGNGFTTITMAAAGQAVTLLYTNAKWTIVGSFGVVIA